jgi:hypothetical protein
MVGGQGERREERLHGAFSIGMGTVNCIVDTENFLKAVSHDDFAVVAASVRCQDKKMHTW